jgi:dTDP-4-dehydrorhamnose reductase
VRILILGAAGMLGHKLWQNCHAQFETWATVRANAHTYAPYQLFDPQRLIDGVDAASIDSVLRAMSLAKPDVVVNCIGVIKQLPAANDPQTSLLFNSLFPHRLANICRVAGARLVHISTDCVFSGRIGNYKEDDASDADDLYGRTKYLGEVRAADCLVLRTSIIGRELSSTSGLVEWFLSNREGKVRGFTKAMFSGFTTQAFAKMLCDVIGENPSLEGLYHVSSQPISKYDLLCLIREAYGVSIEIDPYPDYVVDRSLDSSLFRKTTGFSPRTWRDMVDELARDPSPYDRWRSLSHGS